VDRTQARVTGSVRLRLYRGSCTVVSRTSPWSLYDERFVTFGADDVYDQADAAGFIRLYGLPYRVAALKEQGLGRGLGPKEDAVSAERPLEVASSNGRIREVA
jgi:argininosuccinate synthase